MKKILAITVLAVFCLIPLVHAAEDTETATVSLTIESLFDLTIASATVSKTLTGTALSTAYDNGYTDMDAGYPTLGVDANEAWYLKIKADAAAFTYTGSGSDPSKPVSDLSMLDAGTSHVATGWDSYNTLTTSNQTFASHTAGVSDESHPCQFRINLDQTSDIPGTYSMDVTYTLTTTA